MDPVALGAACADAGNTTVQVPIKRASSANKIGKEQTFLFTTLASLRIRLATNVHPGCSDAKHRRAGKVGQRTPDIPERGKEVE